MIVYAIQRVDDNKFFNPTRYVEGLERACLHLTKMEAHKQRQQGVTIVPVEINLIKD